MIDPVCRAAFEHGREVVSRRRSAEHEARNAALDRARKRDYQTMNTELARNDERAARTFETARVGEF